MVSQERRQLYGGRNFAGKFRVFCLLQRKDFTVRMTITILILREIGHWKKLINYNSHENINNNQSIQTAEDNNRSVTDPLVRGETVLTGPGDECVIAIVIVIVRVGDRK